MPTIGVVAHPFLFSLIQINHEGLIPKFMKLFQINSINCMFNFHFQSLNLQFCHNYSFQEFFLCSLPLVIDADHEGNGLVVVLVSTNGNHLGEK
jgi:hypothetical protein